MKKQYPNTKDISFARNKRYKLYRNGTFYDLEVDALEMRPLDDRLADPDLARIKEGLAALIKQHDAVRLQ